MDVVIAVGYMVVGGAVVALVEAWRSERAARRPMIGVFGVSDHEAVMVEVSQIGIEVETWAMDYDGNGLRTNTWCATAAELFEMVDNG